MMANWEKNLDIILTMNRKNILGTKGKISMEQAKRKVRLEYKSYKKFLKEQEYREYKGTWRRFEETQQR